MGEINVTGSSEFLKFFQPAADLSEADAAALKYLVLKFPYCQPLHFAYASALKKTDPPLYEAYLLKASAYAPRRDVLHSFIHTPDLFNSQLLSLQQEEESITDTTRQTEVQQEEPEAQELISEEVQVLSVETVVPETEHLQEEPANLGEEPEPEYLQDEPDTPEEITEYQTGEEKPDDAKNEALTDEKIAVESVAASDYFVFNRSAIDPLQNNETGRELIIETESPDIIYEDDTADITKYDDDTLPYTFLWWLHKTRKEYAATYQPYVTNPARYKRAAAGELDQQIIENIFHIQPELNTFQHPKQPATIEFELQGKENDIIERFIKEEPQIRPPQADKLDTENKARKSSEDNFDLVSETLAKIYTDQMLYHKAIEIYKKLSLKFPDKKLYFAGQIEELEKKIS